MMKAEDIYDPPGHPSVPSPLILYSSLEYRRWGGRIFTYRGWAIRNIRNTNSTPRWPALLREKIGKFENFIRICCGDYACKSPLASLNFLLTFMQQSKSSHRPHNPQPLHKPILRNTEKTKNTQHCVTNMITFQSRKRCGSGWMVGPSLEAVEVEEEEEEEGFLFPLEEVWCRGEGPQEWAPPGDLMTSRAPSAGTGPWTGASRGSWARPTTSTSRDSAETAASCSRTPTSPPATRRYTVTRNLPSIP